VPLKHLNHIVINTNRSAALSRFWRGKIRNELNKRLKRLMKQNGLPEISAHKLRHTYASLLVYCPLFRFGVYMSIYTACNVARSVSEVLADYLHLLSAINQQGGIGVS